MRDNKKKYFFSDWDMETWIKGISCLILLPYALWVWYFLTTVVKKIIEQ